MKYSCCIASGTCGVNPHLPGIVISNCHYVAFAMLPQLAIWTPEIDMDILERLICLLDSSVVGSPMLFGIHVWLTELLFCIRALGWT